MTLEGVMSRWRSDPDTKLNFPVWRKTPARQASFHPFPDTLPKPLVDSLIAHGISKLYSHQVEAFAAVKAWENVVLATGTASGKTLAYNLPVLSTLLLDKDTRALYLFPTKALAQDQLSALGDFHLDSHNLKFAIYDGDTPQSHRPVIRQNAHLILSNPDMLHTGILPHHTNWGDFFRNLRFVIIDEMHTYRGVFGSHFANVLRRLKRVAHFYGSNPVFILSSATIGNPQQLAENLIEDAVKLIMQDGSARGERHFLIYNPPIVDESLGLRKSLMLESMRLTQDLLDNGVQSLVFTRSRRSVEILLKYLQEFSNGGDEKATRETIRGYRSGYLPSQRREIEKGLREGKVKAVIATNALELGIDIGGLGAAVLVGYPGTIASVWQQAGRAGRGNDPAMSVLVASPGPLDQFLAHHPDYFFSRSPEQALVNPDHLLILLSHLRCAMFELPFEKGEGFGRLPAETVREFLDVLVSTREAHLSNQKYFWMADSYPAAGLSLRSASPENVVLQVEQGKSPWTLGQVDLTSAYWMVHPRAIYLHEGQQYFVQDLDLEAYRATLKPVALDYYTEPQRQTEISVLSQMEQMEVPGGIKGWGELRVKSTIVGFKKLRWLTRENLGMEPLDLPPTEFETTGYWVGLSEDTVTALSKDGLWSNTPNDYGPHWSELRLAVRTRDDFRCQVCGRAESGREHDVHHKTPFRQFRTEAGRINFEIANQLANLITLCPECHKQVERNVRMRSGLAGLGFVLGQLAPLFLMCDPGDLGIQTDPGASVVGMPSVVIYDDIPAGIGFSQKLYEIHQELVQRALDLVTECECEDGCPSCVGPGGENGMGGKVETREILKRLIKK